MGVDIWLIEIDLSTGDVLQVVTQGTSWTPAESDWTKIKQLATKASARLRVFGVAEQSPGTLLARGEIAFAVSADPVGAPPIFHREGPAEQGP
jgi:hypothetical protein